MGANIAMPNLMYSQEEDLLRQIFKKDAERDTFQRFLDSQIDGLSISDYLYQIAKTRINSLDFDRISLKDEVVEALIQKYKRQPADGMSAYDRLVFDLISADEGADLAHMGAKSFSFQKLAPDFPSKRKRAEVLLRGKISGDLNSDDVREYLVEKVYAGILREYGREMFQAINAGLGERVVDYLILKYKLDQLETKDPLSRNVLQKALFEAFKNRRTLEIVHVKSLRFTYPSGQNLKIVEHTGRVEQQGLGGRRVYPSEEAIFSRISRFVGYCQEAGLLTNLTVIVSDPDLDYCFPAGQKMVPQEDVLLAKDSATKYVSALEREFSPQFATFSLNHFLDFKDVRGNFESIVREVENECRAGGGNRIKAKVLEDRVNEQFEHYREMFGQYNREQARFTAVCQIANVIALTAVFESFPSIPIFVCDTRGIEDELIGSYRPNSVAKFFMKLKDPVEIVK